MTEQTSKTLKFILGKKVGMTRVFDKSGKIVPVTVVEAGPCVITQVKTVKNDSYSAVQVGFGKAKKISKPKAGVLKGLGMLKYFVEFKVAEDHTYKVGDKVSADLFAEGDMVKVSGISKSKGFEGVMKRHGFAGGPKSHGQKHSARERGSSGPIFPQHVIKGTRMPGRMGGVRATVRKLSIISIDKDNNLLAIKGAIPGRKGTLIEVLSEKTSK